MQAVALVAEQEHPEVRWEKEKGWEVLLELATVSTPEELETVKKGAADLQAVQEQEDMVFYP